MRSSVTTPLTIFYDGQCIVCDHEVRFYQRRCKDLVLVDISQPSFSAETYGKAYDAFMAQLHVQDALGHWYVGIEAFRAIWSAIPGKSYNMLAEVVGWPLFRTLASIGYKLFARYRHHLPRNRRVCEDGSCRSHE